MLKNIGSKLPILKNVISCSSYRSFTKISDLHTGPYSRTASVLPSTKLSYKVSYPFVQELDYAFEDIYQDLTRDLNQNLPEVAERIRKILEYVVLPSKRKWASIIFTAYQALKPKDADPNTSKLVIILAWILEIMKGSLVVIDDILDNGINRHGHSCWFRLPEIGLQAVNDAMLLEKCAFKLLKKNLTEKPYYYIFQDVLTDMLETLSHGQVLDMAVNPTGCKPNFDLLTLKNYRRMAEYKCARAYYVIPVFLVKHLIDNYNEHQFQKEANVLRELGHFTQWMDDYIDLYVNIHGIVKTGSDIQEGKCTWFAATALQLCSDSERKVFKENYGIRDPEAEKNILNLYDSLSLKEKFKEAQDDLYSRLLEMISQLDHDELSHDLFINFLERIYKADSYARRNSIET